MTKLIIPKFDINNKFIGYKIIEVSEKMNHEDEMKVIHELPGIPQGYCPALGKILQTKEPIEITRLYDGRQNTRKIKGFYISILIEDDK